MVSKTEVKMQAKKLRIEQNYTCFGNDCLKIIHKNLLSK